MRKSGREERCVWQLNYFFLIMSVFIITTVTENKAKTKTVTPIMNKFEIKKRTFYFHLLFRSIQ
jgi:hypothetical protein